MCKSTNFFDLIKDQGSDSLYLTLINTAYGLETKAISLFSIVIFIIKKMYSNRSTSAL